MMSEPVRIAIFVRDSIIERVSTAGVPVDFVTVERDWLGHDPDCDHVALGGERSCVFRAPACSTQDDNRIVLEAFDAADRLGHVAPDPILSRKGFA